MPPAADALPDDIDALRAALAAEDAAAIPEPDAGGTNVRPFTRRRPSRGPLPAHLPRERVVLPAPTACPRRRSARAAVARWPSWARP
jgi:hypothetical protein